MSLDCFLANESRKDGLMGSCRECESARRRVYYAANIELAEAVALLPARAAATQTLTKAPTPGKSTCADVAELLTVL